MPEWLDRRLTAVRKRSCSGSTRCPTGSGLAARWLAERIRVPTSSWPMPPGTCLRPARRQGGVRRRIFRVRRSSISTISPTSKRPAPLLPSIVKFCSRMRRPGLGDGTRIVVYDNNRYSASARVVDAVPVRASGGRGAGWRPGQVVELATPGRHWPVVPREAHLYQACQNHLLVRDLEQVRANLVARRAVIDACSSGASPARARAARGAARRAYPAKPQSAPSRSDRRWWRRHRRRSPSSCAGASPPGRVDQRRPIVTTCGSGVTACTVALALYLPSAADAAVYDGSWSAGGRS